MGLITKDRHDKQCCCPTCRGLVSFDRPQFGSGQVLAASDLTALQTYVQGKNRLHNRYLHGWGVVCGLEVVCDDCEGSVSIRPGYAIDPCGDDIVVAQATRFDLIAAIRRCNEQARKIGDCDPWVPPPDPGCQDLESHWCVALKYKEVEAAYLPTLPGGRPWTPAQPTCGCSGGCGCGGGCGGSCGCGGASKPKPSSAPAPARLPGLTNSSCTPRRVMECFDVTAVCSPDGCQPTWTRRDDDRNAVLGMLDVLIPTGTLLRKIIDCILEDFKVITTALQADGGTLTALALGKGNAAASGLQLASAHAAVCRLKAAVNTMLAKDEAPVRCQLRRVVSEIVLPAPTPVDERDPNRGAYLDRAVDATTDLIAVVIQLMLDCICHAFIPQCDIDPCDDRVEIACVTVKGGKILRICNHSCRRYAGAFPSMFYWMSLVPVLPLVARMLASICCAPDLLRRNSPLVNDLTPLLDGLDPTGGLRRAMTQNDFAAPRAYLREIAKLTDAPFAALVAGRLDAALSPAAFTGRKAATAKADFKAAGVRAQTVELAEGDEAALRRSMLKTPILKRGDSATLYTREGRVVAVVRDDDSELAALKREVAALTEKVGALEGARRRPPG